MPQKYKVSLDIPPMEQGRKKTLHYRYKKEFTQKLKEKNTLIQGMVFMLKSVSQVMRLCVCLPFKI